MPVAKTDIIKDCWEVAQSASLGSILSWALKHRGADRLSVSARLRTDLPVPTLSRPGVGASVVQLLHGRLIRMCLAKAWAGTQLYKQAGMIFIAQLDHTLKNRMLRVEDKFFGWTRFNDPPLPEDICIYRYGDKLPIVFSVTHEEDAWVFHDGKLDRKSFVRTKVTFPSDLIPRTRDFYLAAPRFRF